MTRPHHTAATLPSHRLVKVLGADARFPANDELTQADLPDANAVRAYVTAKWPSAMQSPLAQAMHGASAMAMLETSDADAVALRGEAMEHAQACLRARDGWTVETLGHNVQSAFGADLSDDECDEIASAAITKATGVTQ